MIDEDALRELLADAAASAPPPGRAPDALLDAVAAAEEEQPARRRPRRLLAAAAVVTVLAAGSAVAFVATDERATRSQLAADPAPGGVLDGGAPVTTTAASGAPLDNRSRQVEEYATTTASESGGAASGATAVPGVPAPATQRPAPPVPADTAKVVKTGSLGLEVGKGTFERSVERITSVVVGLGGYVAESSTTESEGVPHGSIVVRVPAGSFEQLVTDLRGLGEVQSVSSKGTDVTAQFTDLEARLSALTATRDRLLEVLRGARNVGDIIAVQDRITGVQTEIEQVQGQQRLLTDQASLGTLSVTLAEPGAEETRITAEPDDDGLGGAWREARRRFGDAVEGLIEWSGTAAVVGLVGLVVVLLGWLAWTRGRRRLLV